MGFRLIGNSKRVYTGDKTKNEVYMGISKSSKSKYGTLSIKIGINILKQAGLLDATHAQIQLGEDEDKGIILISPGKHLKLYPIMAKGRWIRCSTRSAKLKPITKSYPTEFVEHIRIGERITIQAPDWFTKLLP